nr:fimbrial protein [Dyella sp. ASV24]
MSGNIRMPSTSFRPAHHCFSLIGKLCVLLLLSAIGTAPAWAGNCKMTSPSAPVNGTIPLSGNITVGRDVPVGTELYRTTFWNNTAITVVCDAGTYAYAKNLTVTPYPRASWTPPNGAIAYQTNIPGIGVYIWSNQTGLPNLNTASINIAHNGDNFIMTQATGTIDAWVSYDVTIVKISDPVGTGTLNGSSLPTVQFGVIGSNTAVTLNAQITGSLNIVSRTCTTPNVQVDLGSHYMTELKGVGTTTGTWVNVPIVLNNCPSFFDLNYINTNTMDGGNVVTQGRLAANSIQYSVSPVTSIAVSNQGVMALQSDGVNPTASGIGIQMADSNGNPIAYNQKNQSGLNLTTTNNGNYTINLKARYYQTGASATAGQANGAATITLTYL